MTLKDRGVSAECPPEYGNTIDPKYLRPKTNADHIRSLSDEELADFMSAFCEMSDDCKKCPLFGGCPESDQSCWWEEWLEQPYKEDL